MWAYFIDTIPNLVVWFQSGGTLLDTYAINQYLMGWAVEKTKES